MQSDNSAGFLVELGNVVLGHRYVLSNLDRLDEVMKSEKSLFVAF